MAVNTDKKDHCDLSIRIGGEAGQGMNSISGMLGKAFVRNDLHVFINQDVMSRIRGGHNYTQIRISDRAVSCPSGRVDILVCLDKNTLDLYRDSVDGLIVYDEGKIKENTPSGRKYLPLPMEKIAEETGGNARMANSVASGALMALTGLSLEPLMEILGEVFSQKGDKVVQANRECARQGFERMKDRPEGPLLCVLHPSGKESRRRMLLTGSEAMALGALASNVRLYSAYPMSPATAIMEYLASKNKELGIVVEQAEDEIAAVNMAIGAFFGGARAMTGTSGGGLALMVEGISLAGMTETPLGHRRLPAARPGHRIPDPDGTGRPPLRDALRPRGIPPRRLRPRKRAGSLPLDPARPSIWRRNTRPRCSSWAIRTSTIHPGPRSRSPWTIGSARHRASCPNRT